MDSNSDRNALGIILARGGSKGLPNKNILNLCGKPIIAYTIFAALRAKSLYRVVVSTDDEEIARIASEYKDVEVIMRPPEYANDTASIDFALRHVIGEIERQGDKINIVTALYANVPIRREGIIDEVVKKTILTNADSVQTYTPYTAPPQWAHQIDGDKVSLLDRKYEFAYRRQLLIPAYHPDGAVLVVRYDTLMKNIDLSDPNAFLGTDRRAIIQSPEDTVDIDESIDILWAEFLLKRISKHTD